MNIGPLLYRRRIDLPAQGPILFIEQEGVAFSGQVTNTAAKLPGLTVGAQPIERDFWFDSEVPLFLWREPGNASFCGSGVASASSPIEDRIVRLTARHTTERNSGWIN